MSAGEDLKPAQDAPQKLSAEDQAAFDTLKETVLGLSDGVHEAFYEWIKGEYGLVADVDDDDDWREWKFFESDVLCARREQVAGRDGEALLWLDRAFAAETLYCTRDMYALWKKARDGEAADAVL